MSIGRKNIYVCQKCKAMFITIDKDEGVTPFSLPCLTGIDKLSTLMYYPRNRRRLCNGTMFSNFYKVPQDCKPQFEWFKPDPEAKDLNYPGIKVFLYDDAMKEHIKMGGLDLRKID